MQIRIEPDGHMPVYTQLEQQIRFLILNGDLAPGTRLPTTRQLAGFLRINRNTVLRAYQALAQEGLIDCQQGRGCSVSELPTSTVSAISGQLLEVIDQALERGHALGVSPEDFASYVYARSRQRQDIRAKERVLVVECDEEIAETMSAAIAERLDVAVTPLVLADLREPSADIDRLLREATVVATTFFHVQEVRRLLAGADKEIVALGVKPHLQNLIQVVQVPAGTRVALVCLSESCAHEMQVSLENAGIRGLEPVLGGTDEPEALAEVVRQVPVVIASDLAADDVQPRLRPDQQMIVLDYMSLDEGAIELLRYVVTEKRRAHTSGLSPGEARD